jgi:mannose-1-phosphate guanylyltransferase/mannose-6-phosphate isomerase
MIVPVIIAGGSGSRLWPLSRQVYPKQLFPLVDDKTLFQNTLLRLEGIDDVKDPVVVCNENHRFMIAEQLLDIKSNDSVIILEPVGRNTAPALCIAALKIMESGDDPVLLVLPADHDIKDIESYHKSVLKGKTLAEQGSLVTFGIVPRSPETGYGYIKKGDWLDGKDSGVVKIDSLIIW